MDGYTLLWTLACGLCLTVGYFWGWYAGAEQEGDETGADQYRKGYTTGKQVATGLCKDRVAELHDLLGVEHDKLRVEAQKARES